MKDRELRDKEHKEGGFQAWLIWSVATLFLVFVSNLQWGYGLINEHLGRDLNISLSQIGFIATLYTWVFAAAQILSGSLLDRLGIQRTLPLAICLVSAGGFILAHAQNYEMLLLSQIVLALGASFAFIGAGFVGGKWFGAKKYGFMFGLVQTCSCVGTLIGGFVLSRILKDTPWNEMMHILSIVGFCLAGISFFVLRDRIPVNSSQAVKENFFLSIGRKLFNVCKHPQIWLASFLCAVLFGTLLSLAMVWGGKVLNSHGFASADSGRLILLLWAGVAVGAPLADKISHLLKSRKRTLMVEGSIFYLLLLVFLFIPLPPFWTGVLIVAMGFFNATHMLCFTIVAELVSDLYGGTAAAVVNGIVFLLGGLFLSLPGILLKMDVGGNPISLQMAFIPTLILIAGVLSISALFLKDTFAKDSP